ncbi:Cytochrome C oxidase, mono-heme subunit/FixO superfamily [Verrucomicrobiia bacterium DG1235]|nr:Cytochrome C oxidase, mono-heme subunit/FixO superfamily [Verrucomicrobiae bacterium DG1235]
MLKTAAVGALIAVVVVASRSTSDEAGGGALDGVELGRHVYEAEGCIHCHSQYSRRDTFDTTLWGPETDLPLPKGKEVLIGNRRQGPDLANVGLRRSREWNRLHLMNPSQVSPGSRMPGYAYLFEADDPRGEALLDYLQCLATPNSGDWWSQVYSWDSKADGDLDRGRLLYRRLCVQCHGPEGRGDGVVAGELRSKPRDLQNDAFVFASPAENEEDHAKSLRRIVKYGVAGTSMPGHESLTDEEIESLVIFLGTFRK